jgi:hypothetical protein
MILAVMLVAGTACNGNGEMTPVSIKNVEIDWVFCGDYPSYGSPCYQKGSGYTYIDEVKFEVKNSGNTTLRGYDIEVRVNGHHYILNGIDQHFFAYIEPGESKTHRYTSHLLSDDSLGLGRMEPRELTITLKDEDDIIATYSKSITPTR